MGQLRKIHGELTGLGYQVVAVSPDRPEHVAQVLSKSDIEYTLLSDPQMKVAQAYGVAFKMEDDAYEGLKGFGVDLEERSGQQHRLLPVPAVFVIDRDGVIRFSYVNPNYKVRIEPDVLLAAARAAKQKDKK